VSASLPSKLACTQIRFEHPLRFPDPASHDSIPTAGSKGPHSLALLMQKRHHSGSYLELIRRDPAHEESSCHCSITRAAHLRACLCGLHDQANSKWQCHHSMQRRASEIEKGRERQRKTRELSKILNKLLYSSRNDYFPADLLQLARHPSNSMLPVK
jgi:hypothetical protein